MAKLSLKAGTTSKMVTVFAADSSSTTGAGLTGLVYNTASLSAYYYREGAGSATAITLATMTLGTWATGGFVVVDGTNTPGVYSLGIPDAALAAGAKSVVIMLKGATNLAPVILEVELVAIDTQDAVRMGMSALPNAAAEAAGGLYTRGTGAGQINQDANGRIDINAKAWLGGTIPAVNVTGVPKVDLVDWLGSAPAALSTNGYVQGMLLRWLTDNAGGTPSALNSGTVQADAERWLNGVIPAVNVTGVPKVDVVDWLGTAPATPNTNGVPVVDYRGLIRTGTAQSTGNSTTAIKLDSGASATDGFYKGALCVVISGTGAPEYGLITAYAGATKIATITPAWPTAPDSTSVFVLLPGMADVESWGEGAVNALVAGRVDASLGANNAGNLTANLVQVNAHAVTDTASGIPDVNAKNHGGTAQTGRDLGASVLLSSGTGVGQLDFTSGVVKANLVQILATALTETAGQIAAAFKKWFNVATPTGTVNSIPDAVAGAAGGLFIAGTNAATAVTTALTTNITGNLSGSVGSVTAAVTITGQIKKNVGINNFTFPMPSATDHVTPTTGLTVAGTVIIDGAAPVTLTNSIAEIGSTGYYKVNLANADVNGTLLILKFTATGADPQAYLVETQT